MIIYPPKEAVLFDNLMLTKPPREVNKKEQRYSRIQVKHGYSTLAVSFDNAISSVQVGSTATWAYLFDFSYFGGDCFAIAGENNVSMMSMYGWNDRASSLRVD